MRGSHPTDSPRNNHLPRLKVPRRRVTLSLLNKIEALSQSLDKDTKEGLKKVGQEGDSGGLNIKTVSFWLKKRFSHQSSTNWRRTVILLLSGQQLYFMCREKLQKFWLLTSSNWNAGKEKEFQALLSYLNLSMLISQIPKVKISNPISCVWPRWKKLCNCAQ